MGGGGVNSFLSEKGVYSNRKEFAPNGDKFFPFRVDPLFRRGLVEEKQIGSKKKSCLPCQKGGHYTECSKKKNL